MMLLRHGFKRKPVKNLAASLEKISIKDNLWNSFQPDGILRNNKYQRPSWHIRAALQGLILKVHGQQQLKGGKQDLVINHQMGLCLIGKARLSSRNKDCQLEDTTADRPTILTSDEWIPENFIEKDQREINSVCSPTTFRFPSPAMKDEVMDSGRGVSWREDGGFELEAALKPPRPFPPTNITD